MMTESIKILPLADTDVQNQLQFRDRFNQINWFAISKTNHQAPSTGLFVTHRTIFLIQTALNSISIRFVYKE
jgi:hypothetical protein